jgi:hypothetical protein
MNNEKEPILDVPLVEKRFDTNNFKILGLSLTTLGFDDVAARLGKAAVVERGDASYSRSQACYFSGSGSDTIHLIFEGGEGGSSTVYIFRGGPDWKGSNLCVRSNRVSSDLATGTGLRLGLSRAEVEAILGKPDSVHGNRVSYCRAFKRKATKEEFDIQEVLHIEARFTNQGLIYFFVSTTSIVE